ncbi:MAG: hypothetical protein SFX74_04105 [Fimbriimonadaceae bacterium]|nr:hypothetical protein [Fimbriimonadaceae bacterium]
MLHPGLVLLTVLSARQAAPVNLDLPASRIPVVLDSLGQVTGETYEVAPEMQSEIVLVRSKTLTAEQLRTHLAKATAGRWDRTANGYRLVPDVATRNAQRLAEVQAAAQGIRKALISRVNPPRRNTDQGEMDSEMSAVFGGMGGSDRAIAQLLLGVDLTRIARLGPSERVSYSTRPTSLQLPLPSDATAVINQYVLAHNTRVQSAPNVDSDDMFGAVANMVPAVMREALKNRNRPIGAVTRATISISPQSILDGYQATLRLFDAQGKTVHSNTTMFVTDPIVVTDRSGAAPSDTPAPSVEVAATTTIAYSELSKKLRDAPGSMMDGPSAITGIKLEPAVRNALRNPDQFDPLSFEATDIFRAVATRDKATDFVIVPADDSDLTEAKPETVEAVLAQIKQSYLVSQSEGTLIITPLQPDRVRRTRTNRIALAQLIAASESKGMAGLGDFANFAAQSAPLQPDQICFRNYAIAVTGTSGFSMFDTDLQPGLRFLGQLDATVRGKIARGESIPFSILPPAALAEFLLSTASKPSGAGKPSGLFGGRFEMISSMFGGDGSEDPTEAMPFGIPRDGVLTSEVTSEPAFAPVADEGKVMPMISCLGLDEMALLSTAQNASSTDVRNQVPQFDKVRIGSRTIYSLKFQISPSRAVYASFDDNRFPANAPIASMKKLPADVERQLKARSEAVQKSFIGQMMNMAGSMFGGGGGIPPQ